MTGSEMPVSGGTTARRAPVSVSEGPSAREDKNEAQIATGPLRLFHGGPPGLRPGDFIEPRPPEDTAHLLDGCPTCEARKRGEPLPDDDNDPTLIYVTTDRLYASLYASGYPDGGLYRVEPIGDLTPSNDPLPSWSVPAARVVSVLDPLVRLSAHDIRRLERRVAKADALNTPGVVGVS